MNPNITINITVTTPEAAFALLQGLGIQQQSGPSTLPPDPAPTIPNVLPMTVAPAAPTYPTPSPAYPAPVVTAPQPPAVPSVPVGQPPAYALEDLSRAAIPLMDAGRQQEVANLLASFGVQALTQLPREQYGAFATALRGLGARI